MFIPLARTLLYPVREAQHFFARWDWCKTFEIFYVNKNIDKRRSATHGASSSSFSVVCTRVAVHRQQH
jgi:hypothetical protein